MQWLQRSAVRLLTYIAAKQILGILHPANTENIKLGTRFNFLIFRRSEEHIVAKFRMLWFI